MIGVGAAFGGPRSDPGEPVGEVEGVGRKREGGAQAGHLVQGWTDQARPVVRGGGPGTEEHLGSGKAQMRRDVPAGARCGLPAQSDAPEGESGISGSEPGDVEGPSGWVEMRWISALCMPCGMGRAARSCSARRGAGGDSDEMEASVVMGKGSGPGEGVARSHREVVILAVVDDVRLAIADDDLSSPRSGRRGSRG